jgi:murein DD-endopeptidase MepM/ murein hydrolase activator NlpD
MSEPYYGFMITLDGDDGYTYNYIHLNNDTPGTDDGQGGSANAYAPGIRQGVRVERGQHIAWVGDSGNAESVGAHLHFEIYDGSTAIDPYESLLAAEGGSAVAVTIVIDELSYDPSEELERASSISLDKELEHNDESLCEPDSLIRTLEVSTVYYCGTDGGRYVFQNESTFFSWYDSFENVEFVTTEDMASIPLSGSVTYKPGSYMLKILSSPNVYAVGHGGFLHWIPSAEIAEALYGTNWASFVRDIPDGFWGAYEVGEDVTTE